MTERLQLYVEGEWVDLRPERGPPMLSVRSARTLYEDGEWAFLEGPCRVDHSTLGRLAVVPKFYPCRWMP